MDISWLGHASFKIKGKTASIVTDPYGEKTGLKFPKVEADIITISHDHYDHNAVELIEGKPFVINGPGEYEVKGTNVVGIPSYHDTKKEEERGKRGFSHICLGCFYPCSILEFLQLVEVRPPQVIGTLKILLYVHY